MRRVRAADEPLNLDRALPEIVDLLVSANSRDLAHIDPTSILFIAGSARRDATASIRPLLFSGGKRTDRDFTKPEIIVNGRLMRYEICLRPLFFRACNPQQRLRVLAHELWHIDPSFDGSLAPDRRHTITPTPETEPRVDRLVRALQTDLPRALSPLSHCGPGRIAAWLSRPPSRIPRHTQIRVRYSEADLFTSTIEML